MTHGRKFAIFWPLGLVVFAIVVMVSLPLNIEDVPGGILDHQTAGNAAAVDAIHGAWKQAGVFGTASTAMIGDLIFIGLYGFGCYHDGRAIMERGQGMVRPIGIVVVAAALVFTASDYGETICQFMQVQNDAGSDRLAGIAAFLQPVKSICFMIASIGVILGMLLTRFTCERI